MIIRISFLVLILIFSNFKTSSGWFIYGDVSWQSVGGNVTFMVRTAWDPAGYPSNLYTGASASDTAAQLGQWYNALQNGKGSTFGVPGSRIFLGDGSSLQSSLILLNVTRMDSDSIFAYVQFSYTYSSSGTYLFRFEGCCRPQNIQNNAGSFWSIQSNVSVNIFQSHTSPIINMPPYIQLRRSESVTDFASFRCNAVHSSWSWLTFRVGSPAEMGAAADQKFRYSSPIGLTVDASGSVTIAVGSSACSTPASACLYQITIIVEAGNRTATVDFLVRLVSTDVPSTTYSGYLITPMSSRTNPVTIQCGLSEFLPPVNTTFRVSGCLELSQQYSFQCPSFRGICPSPTYAFVRPYYLIQYER
jgi:hypothetical protein